MSSRWAGVFLPHLLLRFDHGNPKWGRLVMNTRMPHQRNAILLLAAALVGAAALPQAAMARSRRSTKGRLPVVMEEATVRGKVIVLENRKEDRRILRDLSIRIWSGEGAARKLLHETVTDDLGLFSVPMLKVGEYRMTVAELNVRLSVIPKAD